MLRTIGIAIAFMLLPAVTSARADDAPSKVLPAECRKIDRCIPTREILDRSGVRVREAVQNGETVRNDETSLDPKTGLDKTWIRLDTVENPILDAR